MNDIANFLLSAALPVLNMAGASGQIWPQLLVANIAVLVVLVVLERGWGFRYESSKDVVYERIELIHPDRRAELLADLRGRTGLEIKRVAIGKVDFVKSTTRLRVYFDSAPDQYANGANGASDDDDD